MQIIERLNLMERLKLIERLGTLQRARKTLLILMLVSFAGFALPLTVFFSTVSVPSEVKQETALVSYEQRGSFDYLVYMKPATLYGTLTGEPSGNPRYPTAMVEALQFTFSFKPAEKASLSGRVEAVLENPGIWHKNLNLTSGSTSAGDLVMRFTLDTGYLKGLFDEIENRLNLTGQTRNITLNAYIEGAGDPFTQTLAVKLGGDFIEVDDNLKLTGPSGTGSYQYAIELNSGTGTNSYPMGLVNTVEFTFNFSSLKQQAMAGWIDAVLENPGVWRKSVRLASGSTVGANFILNFTLDAAGLQALYDKYDAETGVTSSSRNVTLRADISAGSDHFVQNLPVKLSSTLLEIDNNLKSAAPTSTGAFSYIVRLKENTVYGRSNIEVPDPALKPSPDSEATIDSKGTPATSLVTLRPGEVIFAKLVERMDVTYNYKLASDKTMSNVATDVSVDAVIEAPGLWSKKFRLLAVRKGGDFSLSFPVDVGLYGDLLETIRSETGVSADSYNLTIATNVHAVADTSAGKINTSFIQNMKGTFKGNVLEWDKELTVTKPGAINELRSIPNPMSYLGLSIVEVKILSIALASIFFLSLTFSLMLFVTSKAAAISDAERETLEIKKMYGQRMAEATGQTAKSAGDVIYLSSMADLVTVADELGKPIIHELSGPPPETHVYFVLDGTTQYRYPAEETAGDNRDDER